MAEKKSQGYPANEKPLQIIGLMSGTSLDGVDLAYCIFRESEEDISFNITVAETIPYPEEWKNLLAGLPLTSAMDYAEAHASYGRYLGHLVSEFIDKYSLNPDYIASHGHTIFHQPEKGFTSQLGDGASIAAMCGIPVICDFRSGDVAHGGQGAPLVPIGDERLFSGYDYCLNLGGFANISFRSENTRRAFDICPVNIVLNRLAAEMGYPYDEDGKLSSSGQPDASLLHKLDSLGFYTMNGPKSLGREWVEQEFLPFLEASPISLQDKLRTSVEHMAKQVASQIKQASGHRMLVTGGGAFNSFLIDRIKSMVRVEVIVPDQLIVNYKEALIFAFLGYLRVNKLPNSLCSVTGANKDVAGGCIYLP